MKYLALFLFVISTRAADAQSACEQWFPYGEGEGFKLETRDAAGNPTGFVRFTVLDITGSGDQLTYTVKRDIHDEATDKGSSAEYPMKCDGEKMYIDARAFYFPGAAAAMEGMEAEMESDNLIMPADLSVGDAIPEASLRISMKMEGREMGSMVLNFTEKEVTGSERITVPAGTFDCLKIEGKINMEMNMMSVPVNFSTSTVQWYAKGTGMVKGESYDESGNLSGSVVLAEKF